MCSTKSEEGPVSFDFFIGSMKENYFVESLSLKLS